MANAGRKKAVATDTLAPTFAGAGVMSVVMYPVDVVRALCMSTPGLGAKDALQGFLKTHGVMGFVKQGMAVEVFRSSLARGIKFWVQPLAHEACFGPQSKGTYITKGLSGVIAVFPEVWAISSMENIKLAQQLDKDKKIQRCCRCYTTPHQDPRLLWRLVLRLLWHAASSMLVYRWDFPDC
jgi:hypothetical protein